MINAPFGKGRAISLEGEFLVAFVATGIVLFFLGLFFPKELFVRPFAFLLFLGGVGALLVLGGLGLGKRLFAAFHTIEGALDTLAHGRFLSGFRAKGEREVQELEQHLADAARELRARYLLLERSRRTLEKKLSSLEAARDAERGEFASKEKELLHKIQEISVLRELSERIGYSLNIQKIVEIITGSLGKLLSYSSVSYMILDHEGVRFHCHLEEPVSETYVREIRRKMIRSIAALSGKDIPEDKVETALSGAILDETVRSPVGSFFNGPLVIDGKTVGMLNVASMKLGNYTEEEMTILFTITKQVADAFSKLQLLLEAEKGKLSAMVSSMIDGVVMVDRDLRITVANPATRRMLGLGQAQDEVTIFDLMKALAGSLDLREKLIEAIKLEKIVEIPELLVHGTSFFQTFISPVRERGEVIGAVILFHDITKEKELENLREDFTSMMVHELRSPLSGIKSVASLLTDTGMLAKQEEYREFIGLIASNTQQMLDLVNDLLDVAKLESGKFLVVKETGDFAKLLSERVSTFGPGAREKGITLEVNIPEDLPRLSFDARRIVQVVNNFLANAIKFTPRGGKVRLAAFRYRLGDDMRATAQSRGLLRVPSLTDASGEIMLVVVEDTGQGIPSGELPKLFSKFQQLSTARQVKEKGTGLGLVIAKGIVEAHGGHVGVSSVEGKGATFWFTLPLAST